MNKVEVKEKVFKMDCKITHQRIKLEELEKERNDFVQRNYTLLMSQTYQTSGSEHMSIVVTGAAGFIGSHLSKRLEDEGHDLILIDDFSRGKKENLKSLVVKTK